MQPLNSKDIVNIVITLVLVLYNVILLPRLDINNLYRFNNVYIRALWIVSIVFVGYHDPLLSLLLSITFILTHIKYSNLLKNKDSEYDNL
jgi:hypothetical protein